MIFSPEELKQIQRINNPFADIEDYRAFFRVFGVELQDEDGNYKSVYDVFKEASKAYHKRLENNKEN